LVALLSQTYRVIAPDLPGNGFTEFPEERKYGYTFENLTPIVEAFLNDPKAQKGLSRGVWRMRSFVFWMRDSSRLILLRWLRSS